MTVGRSQVLRPAGAREVLLSVREPAGRGREGAQDPRLLRLDQSAWASEG